MTTDPTATTTEAVPPTTETTATTTETEAEGTRPEREAAKYRTRLRDVEAERDTLAARVLTMQRAEAERVAAQTIAQPAGLWAAGTDLADLTDDDGNIDPQKVAAAAQKAATDLGLARAQGGPVIASQGDVPHRPLLSGGFAAAFGPAPVD